MSTPAAELVVASMNDVQGQARLWLVRTFGERSPIVVGVASTLLVGAVGSLFLLVGIWLGVREFDLYRSGIQLWMNAVGVGYIVWLALYEVRRSAVDLAGLAPILRTFESVNDPDLFARDRNPRALRAFTVAGLVFGVLYNITAGGVLFQWLAGIPIAWEYGWGPPVLMTLWAVAFHGLWILIDNSVLFARLATQSAEVDLLRLDRLDAFIGAGTRHLLLLVIGLSVLPAQAILIGGLRPLDFVPALIVVLPVGVFLFVWPVLAVRRAIVRAKRTELARIDAALGAEPPLGDRRVLLSLHRRDVARTSVWPVSLVNLARLALYLVIPPLAWIAAALVQSGVGRFL